MDQYHINDIKLEVGRLTLFIGPMFSRKTTYLINEICTCADIGFRCLYINHAADVRTTEANDGIVSTHSSQFRGLSDKIHTLKVSALSDLNVDDYDVIGVDEANFFNDLYRSIVDWVEVKNKIVFVAGLDGDILKRPIGHTLDLIPHADSVLKLKAHCKPCLIESRRQNRRLDLVDAAFTVRLTDDNSSVVVGGADLYIPVCRRCYRKHYANK